MSVVTSNEGPKLESEDGVVLTNMKNTETLLPPDEWPNLNFNELIEQKTLIWNKWEWLEQNGNNLHKEFAVYLTNIDNYIQTKF